MVFSEVYPYDFERSNVQSVFIYKVGISSHLFFFTVFLYITEAVEDNSAKATDTTTNVTTSPVVVKFIDPNGILRDFPSNYNNGGFPPGNLQNYPNGYQVRLFHFSISHGNSAGGGLRLFDFIS